MLGRPNPVLTGLCGTRNECYKPYIPAEFRVLGPLAVVEDGRSIPLDRQRLRSLLGFLLLHANEPVSSDKVIDEVWGPNPPKTAGASLQNYVSRLRKAIGAEQLLSVPGGYLLRIDPEQFDLTRFERLTAEAHGANARERAEKLRAALALWRGPALEDLAFEPFAQDEARRLEEARLAVLEERIEADLELGLAVELVGELEELVAEHPLRERFHGQLMRALYRAGRQADALEAFQSARRLLLGELGLEPSDDLRKIQQAILQQDPSLVVAESARNERGPDRRTVTILFCDLVNSTRLANELDPEAYRELMSRYFEVVRVPIERHGGTIEKFIGDAVMAVFGVPDLHEDDALRAVRAATELHAALRDGEWAVSIAARVGIGTGEVHVLSSPGEDLRVSGAVASFASKLEESAPSGGIVISDETHALVREAVQSERATHGWVVDDVVAGVPGYSRSFDSPLIGRKAELERLRTAYESACLDRHCCVVTVIGEAGIGKTRLARELVASAPDHARVLVGRCVSYGEGATYLPIAEIVRQAANEASLAGIYGLLRDEEDADTVAQRIAELVGLTESPAAPGEAFWAVRRLLETIAREHPVLVTFDDIHWAEPTLLDLVEYLGRWASGPIFILCLARRDLFEARPGWGGPTSTGFVVELDSMQPDELASLVEQLATEPVDPDLEEQIVEHSGGNPLFAEQLLAYAKENPEGVPLRLPGTVEALLASRLDRLPPHELNVLRRASVIGRRFSEVDLGDVADGKPAHHLRRLSERGLVHPVGEALGFHHVLVRDVAYRGIPKSERADLHERAALGLDRRNGADELVGYHFEQAFTNLSELSRDDERREELAHAGCERLGRAGIRAWKRADAPAAVNLLSRAVALRPDATEFACELGVALRVRGEFKRSETVLEAALATAIAADDPRLASRAKLELAHVRSVLEPQTISTVLAVAEEAIPVFESFEDDRALGRAWFHLADVRGSFYCDNAAWAEAARKAATHYRRAGWSPALSVGGIASALYHGTTPADAALQECEALLMEHAGDRASEANIQLWMGPLAAMLGRFEEARRVVAGARARWDELGQSQTVVIRGFATGIVEMLAQRPEVAEEALRESCIAAERLHESAQLANRAAELADVLYMQGQYEEAESWAIVSERNSATDDRSAQAAWRGALAKVRARAGAAQEGEELAREEVALTSATDSLNDQARALLDLAEVLRVADRQDEANEATRSGIALLDRKGNVVAAERARGSIAVAT
jgi:DNA-binding SARP family transcriptional activator